MYKIFTVLGTRPEIIKLSRIINIFDKNFNHKIIHTGQNFDYELNDIFFKELDIRKPDFYLNCAKATAIKTISSVLSSFEDLIKKDKPDAIFILGDTNSSFAALAAKKNNIPVFHYEAGNRCYDNSVPEELNRKLIDHVADLNLTYTNISKQNLINEGLHPEKIIYIGSPMKEVLNFYNHQVKKSKILKKLNIKKNSFFLVSLHREENVDNQKKLKEFFESIVFLCSFHKKKAIISTHFRTAKRLEKLTINNKNLIFKKPFGFIDYIQLQKNSFITLSDSGTLSEESSIIGRSSIHLRHCTERPEGIENGAIILGGSTKKKLNSAVNIVKQLNKVDNHESYNKDNVSNIVLKSIISYLDYYK
jgi:UDP-N-acetylglucosamine 2-epimerase (non-hydrolysing)